MTAGWWMMAEHAAIVWTCCVEPVNADGRFEQAVGKTANRHLERRAASRRHCRLNLRMRA